MRTPIALFSYNRPEHVNLALETLTRCARFRECDLHIFCDGPKRPEHKGPVEASRLVVRSWAERVGARVVERTENLGLARSVVAGVSELCDAYGRVIVVEDDFALRPDFLDYMIRALDKYADCKEIYQVSGYMFPVEHPPRPDAFFLPLSTTWGWATWSRAWRIFDWRAASAPEQLADPAIRRKFDLDNSYPYANMLEDRLAGKNDSWGILWWWAVFRIGGLVLYPRRSLVRVGGFDGSGTHCRANRRMAVDHEEIDSRAFSSGLDMPTDIIVDWDAFDRIKRYLKGGYPAKVLGSLISRAMKGFKFVSGKMV